MGASRPTLGPRPERGSMTTPAGKAATDEEQHPAMGFLKDLKNMTATASSMAGQAQAVQAAALHQQTAAAAPADLSDPAFAPIHGVTLDEYARISAQLVRSGASGIPAVQAFAEGQGVPAGRWAEVQQGWVQRMAQSMEVRTRYGVIYAQS